MSGDRRSAVKRASFSRRSVETQHFQNDLVQSGLLAGSNRVLSFRQHGDDLDIQCVLSIARAHATPKRSTFQFRTSRSRLQRRIVRNAMGSPQSLVESGNAKAQVARVVER
jgi:hypothetical protein